MEVWAVYATNKAWLFACRNDTERGEWIWAVDRSYVERSVGGGSGEMSPEEEEW
jgi:kinesin family protein 1